MSLCRRLLQLRIRELVESPSFSLSPDAQYNDGFSLEVCLWPDGILHVVWSKLNKHLVVSYIHIDYDRDSAWLLLTISYFFFFIHTESLVPVTVVVCSSCIFLYFR